jgi:7-cyano-7-deazaguanine reductase
MEQEFRRKLRGKVGSPQEVDPNILEVVNYNYQGERDIQVEISCPEFTSLCPQTGLPDFGKLTIRYTPGGLIIELKSLKYYLLQYRQVGVFYEHLVNQILNDLVSVAQPKYMEILGEFTSRGGISTKVRTEYRKEEEKIE